MNSMKTSASTISILVVLCLLIAVAVGEPPTAQGHPSSKGIQTIVEVRPWHVRKILAPRVIEIGTTAASCSGLRPPEFEKVRVVEQRNAVVLTAKVRREHAGECLDEERFVQTRVKLKKALGHRKLKDGSTSPPTRRWPE
jgi:hypothetical protein